MVVTFCFFFNDTATTEIYTLSLHDALPIFPEDLVEHAWLRMQFVIENPHLLPWVVMSKGKDIPDEFPAYGSFFTPLCPDARNLGSQFILQQIGRAHV